MFRYVIHIISTIVKEVVNLNQFYLIIVLIFFNQGVFEQGHLVSEFLHSFKWQLDFLFLNHKIENNLLNLKHWFLYFFLMLSSSIQKDFYQINSELLLFNSIGKEKNVYMLSIFVCFETVERIYTLSVLLNFSTEQEKKAINNISEVVHPLDYVCISTLACSCWILNVSLFFLSSKMNYSAWAVQAVLNILLLTVLN